MLTWITTHVTDSLDRLLEQYRNKVRIAGVITAFAEQIQELEDATFAMVDGLYLANAVGEVLDQIGTIVVQDRLGFADDFYRSLIFAKIGENVSQADPARIVDVVKLLTGATLVHFQEWYPAGYGIGINVEIPTELIDFIYGRVDRVDSAGVRNEALICFDPDEAFAFEGGPGTAEGFGDDTDALAGGLFGARHQQTQPAFSFASAPGFSSSDAGFGAIQDPLYGGILS